LFQLDLFPDRLPFSGRFRIGRFLARILTGPRFLVTRLLPRRRLVRLLLLLIVRPAISRFMTCCLGSGGLLAARPRRLGLLGGRPGPAGSRPGPRGCGLGSPARCGPGGRFRRDGS
jgi:hypothetical protein